MLYVATDHIGEGTYTARVYLDDDNALEGMSYIADGKDNALFGLIGRIRAQGYNGRIIGHGIRD